MDSLQQKFGGEAELPSKHKNIPIILLAIAGIGGVGLATYLLWPERVPAPMVEETPTLTSAEVDSYRATLPRTFSGMDPVVDGATTEDFLIPVKQTGGDPMIENYVPQDNQISNPAGAVESFVPPTEAVTIAIGQDPNITGDQTTPATGPGDTMYIEGDITVSDVVLTQPDRDEKVPYTGTGVVNGFDEKLNKIIVSANGEVIEIDMTGGTIKTNDGKRIPLSFLRTNDILSISGQRAKDAPVVIEATLTLVGVQEFLPAIDIGV